MRCIYNDTPDGKKFQRFQFIIFRLLDEANDEKLVLTANGTMQNIMGIYKPVVYKQQIVYHNTTFQNNTDWARCFKETKFDFQIGSMYQYLGDIQAWGDFKNFTQDYNKAFLQDDNEIPFNDLTSFLYNIQQCRLDDDQKSFQFVMNTSKGKLTLQVNVVLQVDFSDRYEQFTAFKMVGNLIPVQGDWSYLEDDKYNFIYFGYTKTFDQQLSASNPLFWNGGVILEPTKFGESVDRYCQLYLTDFIKQCIQEGNLTKTYSFEQNLHILDDTVKQYRKNLKTQNFKWIGNSTFSIKKFKYQGNAEQTLSYKFPEDNYNCNEEIRKFRQWLNDIDNGQDKPFISFTYQYDYTDPEVINYNTDDQNKLTCIRFNFTINGDANGGRYRIDAMREFYDDQQKEEDKKYIEEFCDYCGIEVDYNISPQYNKNEWQATMAMWMAENYWSICSKHWLHDPEKRSIDGFTVAMILSIHRLTPPKEWEHKPELTNDNGQTVAMNQQNIFLSNQWCHDPYLKDKFGQTVAMHIALYMKYIPECWYHQPELQDDDGETVAIILCKTWYDVPPKEWYHDPHIKDKDGHTVADYLRENKKEVPPEWDDA